MVTAPGRQARESLNLAASVGDEVLSKLVEARHALSIVSLGKSIAQTHGLSVADSYSMARAAINNLRHLKLVEVDSATTMVALTPTFDKTFGDGDSDDT